MFLKSSLVSSAMAMAFLVLASTSSLVAVNAQTDIGELSCDFGPDALTNAFQGKSIPRTCFDVPFDDGTIERCYYTYVPSNPTCVDKTVPLVFDIHGRTSCPLVSAGYTGWFLKAEAECFVLVWPSAYVDERFSATCFNNVGFARADDFGLEGGNNVTTAPCCCRDDNEPEQLIFEEPNDPLFLKMAIDDVVESFNAENNNKLEAIAEFNKGLTIDVNRIYMAGHSNGCVMSLGMAALYSDTIAAVCCHSGGLATPFPLDYSPVPIWLLHGEQDAVIPYTGLSIDVPFVGKVGFWSIPQTREYLLKKNDCEEIEVETNVLDAASGVVGTSYKGVNCQQNIEVVKLTDSGHLPFLTPLVIPDYGGLPTTIDTTALAWEFCSAQVRPTPTPTPSPTDFPTASPTKSPKKSKSKKGTKGNTDATETIPVRD